MSKISIEGNASGTATFTIESPATNTNRTLTLPDNTGTIITTAGGAAISGTTGSFSGDLSFNSGFGSAAVAYGCRAWVNFDGTTNTGGNCDIRESGNVSSITDNGTGDYTINFATAMPDADYAASYMGSSSNTLQLGAVWYTDSDTKTTSAFQVRTSQLSVTGSNVAKDLAHVNVSIFR